MNLEDKAYVWQSSTALLKWQVLSSNPGKKSRTKTAQYALLHMQLEADDVKTGLIFAIEAEMILQR